MREHVNSVTQEERKSLESTYRASVVTCTFTIAVSIIALLFVVLLLSPWLSSLCFVHRRKSTAS